MTKRNYTREILTQVRAGRVPVSSVGPEYVVQYAPRSKSDPQPWVSGAYRYNGREVHTMEPCGRPLLSMRSGGMTTCMMHADHDLACRSDITYIRYTYSGREVHTVIQTCGQTVAFGSGRCVRPKRHNGMCHD